MTTEIVTRSGWGAAPAHAGPGPLDPRQVEGIALHWPGASTRWEGIAAVAAALRSWQAQHQQVRGWSDIAYQEAIDQEGRVYLLRGLSTQSGANGDTDVNERFGALLLVLGIGETPSQAMVGATRDRIRRHRALFPNSHRVVPHSGIRPDPTDCPGDIVRHLIDSDAFDPQRTRSVRGMHVDEALHFLQLADGQGKRRAQLDAAIKAVRAIDPIHPREG